MPNGRWRFFSAAVSRARTDPPRSAPSQRPFPHRREQHATTATFEGSPIPNRRMKSDLGDREERRDDRQADAARQREEPHGETDGEAAQRADRPAAGAARQRRGEMTRELARDDELAKGDQD